MKTVFICMNIMAITKWVYKFLNTFKTKNIIITVVLNSKYKVINAGSMSYLLEELHNELTREMRASTVKDPGPWNLQ